MKIQVDPIALGIPAYPTIIKRPMDYGTINTKLDRREYRSAEECLDDILQVSRNAKTFNPPGVLREPVWLFHLDSLFPRLDTLRRDMSTIIGSMSRVNE
jgi:hypothetical protein